MNFEAFKKICEGIAEKAGVDDVILFDEDEEKGKYTAVFSSGIRMSGNSKTTGITVRWGNGHQAIMPTRVLCEVRV